MKKMDDLGLPPHFFQRKPPSLRGGLDAQLVTFSAVLDDLVEAMTFGFRIIVEMNPPSRKKDAQPGGTLLGQATQLARIMLVYVGSQLTSLSLWCVMVYVDVLFH